MLLARTASSRRPRPRRSALAIAVAVVAALAVAGLAGTRDAGAASTPACYGAAARDPQHPCYNPKLRLRVEPTPDEAELIPNFPCRPVEQDGFFGVCSFGLPQDQAPNGPIALVGDSHAIHWRAAVDVVARAHGWQGLSVTASSCLFSKAETFIPQPARQRCNDWNRKVPVWLKAHPEIHTIFFSHHRGATVVAPKGADQLEAKVRGFLAMWKSLPATVQHIVVIRDVPTSTSNTPGCVMRALRKKMRPQFACARKRSDALKPDAALVAASRLKSPRVQVVDLSQFFCSSRLCYPVVGGVLTHKDNGHITVAFATTLAPYLLRKVDALSARWTTPH